MNELKFIEEEEIKRFKKEIKNTIEFEKKWLNESGLNYYNIDIAFSHINTTVNIAVDNLINNIYRR